MLNFDFEINFQVGRTGEKNIENLTKKHFVIKQDPVSGINHFELVIGEDLKPSKKEAGVIPFMENTFGFNPGKYFLTYLGKLHPQNDWLFGRPDRRWRSGTFNLRENPVFWYEKKAKLGIHTVNNALAVISSEVLQIRRITNGQVRPSVKNFPIQVKQGEKTFYQENIPQSAREKIYELMKILQILMEKDESDAMYEEILNRLPVKFHQNYHKLAQYGVIFLLLSQVTKIFSIEP